MSWGKKQMYKHNTHTIVVFPDGQTWNTIDGCTIRVINREEFDKLCNDEVAASDVPAIVELTMKETTFNVL